MKTKLLFHAMGVVGLMAAMGLTMSTTTSKPPTRSPWTTHPWTTGRPQVNLNGKMFTISSSEGGITLYSPFYPSPYPSTSSHGSRWYTTSPLPSSTLSPNAGWSICLRYLTDYLQRPTQIFSLSPFRNPITLTSSGYKMYSLTCDRYRYNTVSFLANIKLLTENASDMWFSVCLNVDSAKNVAQVFSGSNMSIRKMLPFQCQWREPVISFSGFDGQVTDVQMWDYPLNYREVTDYMSNSAYKLYRGSVLTWSDISYSLNGNTVLEDVYEIQEKEPINRRGRGRRPKGLKRKKKVFNVGEKKSPNLF